MLQAVLFNIGCFLVFIWISGICCVGKQVFSFGDRFFKSYWVYALFIFALVFGWFLPVAANPHTASWYIFTLVTHDDTTKIVAIIIVVIEIAILCLLSRKGVGFFENGILFYALLIRYHAIIDMRLEPLPKTEDKNWIVTHKLFGAVITQNYVVPKEYADGIKAQIDAFYEKREREAVGKTGQEG